MFNMETLKKGIDLKKSKSLLRIANNGENKMYSYLSGTDADSTYNADNTKYILEMKGNIDWNKVEDKSNALFSIGFSDQGNLIGVLTNTNALLQDMLVYCPLEEAKDNLIHVLTLEAGSQAIIGKRYAVDGKSPLTLALPVITKSGYTTYAPVIHKAHSEKFCEIIKTLDIDSLTHEDMILIAKDLGFLSRTQELAIDVAKDKTIEIVDTSQWLNMGIKPKNYYLGKQSLSQTGWYAQDNISEIIDAKKNNAFIPDFDIIDVTPEKVEQKVFRKVATSESVAREILLQATKDYFNNDFKEMLLFSQETALNQKAKAIAQENSAVSSAMKQVIIAYRSYMIDNIPKDVSKDMETNLFINKYTKEKLAIFASICRNTLYKIGATAGLDAYNIALIGYGTDLNEVSKNEGKFFRAIMPEEFKKLYAAGNTSVEKERLFYVDDFIKDDIDEEESVYVEFKNGEAYDNEGILIAKASYKYNAKRAKLTFDEIAGRYYAEIELGISLPEVGDEILILVDNMTQDKIDEINNSNVEIEMHYTPKSPNSRNLLYTKNGDDITVEGTVGYKNLPEHYKYMLINNKKINAMATKKQYDLIKVITDSFERVNHYKLTNILLFNEIICVNKGSNFETYYGIVKIK